MNPEEKAVGHHYDESILTYELERLEKHSRVEFLLTLRALARWVPSTGGVAVDIGVGSGAYSSWLAARGFRVHLVDVSAKLLDATMERLKREGREAQILGRHHRSATDLDTLSDECADVLLALGPLYHLREADHRRKAVCEAARIVKPNGLLFAAGINRMAFLRDAFRHSPGKGALLRESCLKFLEDGQLDPDTAPPIGFAHLTTATEFGALFVEAFERIALWGVDAFTSPAPEKLVGLSREDCEAWLDVVERAAPLPDALGYTDHFLYMGRRARTRLAQ